MFAFIIFMDDFIVSGQNYYVVRRNNKTNKF